MYMHIALFFNFYKLVPVKLQREGGQQTQHLPFLLLTITALFILHKNTIGI